MTPRRRLLVRGSLALLALAGAAAVLWAVATFNPTESDYFPKCQFHAVTGWHCVGCGLTRSAHSWLNGDVPQALAWHPLSFIIFPYLAYHVAVGLWRWLWGPRPNRRRWMAPGWLMWSFAGLLIAFWIARNIPVEPFTYLAPHELKAANTDEGSK